MAIPLQNSGIEPIAASSTGPSSSGWLREPLVHFVLLGALLFSVDHFLIGRADDPRTIVVGAEVDKEAGDIFKATRGRAPTPEEMTALRRVWLDNEILYREGIAMQVDKGDQTIRDRVIFKELSMIDAGVKLPPLNEQVLKTWFEAHRVKYDEPARYSFEEAVLAGDVSEFAVRRFVADLNGGTPGDAKAGLRVFKGRPLPNLLQSYGSDFTTALQSSRPGVWQALKTREGWRAIRLEAIVPPKPAQFDSIRDTVLQDWKDATAADIRTEAVRTLEKKYRVKLGAPGA